MKGVNMIFGQSSGLQRLGESSSEMELGGSKLTAVKEPEVEMASMALSVVCYKSSLDPCNRPAPLLLASFFFQIGLPFTFIKQRI